MLPAVIFDLRFLNSHLRQFLIAISPIISLLRFSLRYAAMASAVHSRFFAISRAVT